MGIIYKATSPSGKSYVGKTVRTLGERKKEHLKDAVAGSNVPLAYALRKYGLNALVWETLEEVSNDRLNEREVFYIARLNTFKSGYNATVGGDSGPCTEEQKRKISESLRGKKQSQETIRKRSASLKGRVCSETTREKISKAHQGMKYDDAHKQKLSLAHLGIKHTEQHKSKISEGLKRAYKEGRR